MVVSLKPQVYNSSRNIGSPRPQAKESAMARRFFLAVLVSGVMAGVGIGQEFGARSYGVRGGVNMNPDQFNLGAQVDMGHLASRIRLQPSFELGSGNGVFLASPADSRAAPPPPSPPARSSRGAPAPRPPPMSLPPSSTTRTGTSSEASTSSTAPSPFAGSPRPSSWCSRTRAEIRSAIP
jgi:hypothetical protein